MLILFMKHNMRSYNHQKSNLKFEKLKEIYDANKEINIIHTKKKKNLKELFSSACEIYLGKI
jgi:hypothetical protein